MGSLLDRLRYFRARGETFAGGHGVLTRDDRSWEDVYRSRWQYDKVVRSTHGVNCTGSCGWKVYVKGGLVTWETQVLDYPRNRPDMPDHEPRGCARGATASWYLYSANRVKYPLMRRALIELWREARAEHGPVEAWASIVEDPERSRRYKSARGTGGLVRASWDEALEIIAASNVYTARRYGPDRICGFSPIPAMSMVSYAAGTRYLSLIGGSVMSFYDWYADLPPASPQTWGEQTDVPESADWYNAAFIMVWGSNVPQTRTPDAHFLAEVRYKGTKTVVVSPDFSEASKFGDLWLAPRQGTDAALALAMGHVILREFHVERPVPYFQEYARQFTDFPFLVRLEQRGDQMVPGRFLRASDLGEARAFAEWKTLAVDRESGQLVTPNGSIGFRWSDERAWNLRTLADDEPVTLSLTALDAEHELAQVAFPYFGAGPGADARSHGPERDGAGVLQRPVPVRTIQTPEGPVRVATVYDLLLAHYGVPRGIEGETALGLDENGPYTPEWQERITGVPAQSVIAVAREFADTAAKTRGRSLVIIGTGVNQWYHSDTAYRSVIAMLLACGCVGVSGGGWAHYVGQEKLRPQTGWQALAFAQDWVRPPRQMNGTSFFYIHSDQWRYETLRMRDLISPTAPEGDWNAAPIDYNLRAVRMGWLPSAPQLSENPLDVARAAADAGEPVDQHVARRLQSGDLELAFQDPDAPQNAPRTLFVWRANLLGASGKGHEYFLRHLVGAKHGLVSPEIDEESGERPHEVRWREPAPEGKLDLLVAIDFRMSTTCVYADIVLPTATWYEKADLSTTDMHPFIHPLSPAVDPLWECRSDWDIFKSIAKRFSELCEGQLGVERDAVLQPLMHDSPDELGQPLGVSDWRRGECEPTPGRTMPRVTLVERDYPNTYERFVALGPLLRKLGVGTKGIQWDCQDVLTQLTEENGARPDPGGGPALPRIETDRQACEAILRLSPETHGRTALRAWTALEEKTGLAHQHLARDRAAEAIRFPDLVAQPRKVITSPTWSGVESEEVRYTGSYLNVNSGIPWRTLTGRQHMYLDHEWMRAFGEGFPLYRPPVDSRAVEPVLGEGPVPPGTLVLNFLTPHQKWGIHSSFSDTSAMLTLSRGGPHVWISETDAESAGLADNDWIEVQNANGILIARAVVSQRIPSGAAFMYHAQDKTVNSPLTSRGTRGLHNSLSRVVVKPTHMIGGYAQLSYGFNYYGTVGANRDDYVVIRKAPDTNDSGAPGSPAEDSPK